MPWYRTIANSMGENIVRLFEGVKDENVAKSYYEALYLLNKRPCIDFNAIDDIEYLKKKYKNLIDEGNESSFISVLHVAIKDYERSVINNKDKEKIVLLLNLVDYFKRMFPEHYMMLQLLKAEYRLKIILEPKNSFKNFSASLSIPPLNSISPGSERIISLISRYFLSSGVKCERKISL